jgi:hypothetical protein
VEEGGVEPNEGAINQPIVEDQANLGLWASISRTKCSFQRGIMLPRFNNKWPNTL